MFECKALRLKAFKHLKQKALGAGGVKPLAPAKYEVLNIVKCENLEVISFKRDKGKQDGKRT